MKTSVSVRFTSAVVLCWLTGLVSLPAQNSREADAVSVIRTRYAAINQNVSKYKTVKKELAGFSTEGGELTAYFEGNAIRKIAAKHQGETGRWFEEYYYWDDELQFVYHKRDNYSEPMSGKVTSSVETRFYFDDGQLIRWLNSKGKPMRRGTDEFAEQQKEYLSNSELFVAGARSNDATIEKPE